MAVQPGVEEGAAPDGDGAASPVVRPGRALRPPHSRGSDDGRRVAGASDDGPVALQPPAPDAAGRPAPAAASASGSAEPAAGSVSAGVLRSEHVRQLRELAPHREVQRLAVDLDGARVAVRLDPQGARLRVLADPAERLGGTWTTDVQRSLNAVLRHQPASHPGQHDTRHGGRSRGDDHPDDPAPPTGGEEFSRRLGRAGRTSGA